MNAKEYKQKTGLEPTQDDLERVNCQQAGEVGHNNCGWCELHDKPRFNCMCITHSKKGMVQTTDFGNPKSIKELEITNMYKSKFSIDGDENEENIVEGYTDGSLWNGWANVCFTREQVSAWLDTSPYDYRFYGAKTRFNKKDYPILVIFFDDREEVIESSPLPTDEGGVLEGYFMSGYCFVDVAE